MKINKFASVLVLLGMIGFAFVPAKSVLFSYKLEKGTKSEIEIKTNQNISMTMSGQSVNIKQDVTLNQSVEITNVSSEGNIDFSIVYDRIRFKQNAMGMEVEWDSDNPEASEGNMMAQQIAAQLNNVIQKTVTATIDPLGNPITNNGSEVLGETNISGFEMGMLVVFPDHEISVGDTWEVVTKPDPSSDFAITAVYKLDEFKSKTAVISFDGTVTGTEMNGTPAQLSGTISGKATIDSKTGWLISSTSLQSLEMEMEQQGQKMPMKMTSYTELTSK
ncbi:MAG: hypothetical protein H0S84_01350 [Bacteroidales bacterium]|jgi:hypothetical protein|nr:hypothetical protein [Bacteroidales bacterium]MDN5348633.1 hypothetical protein [Bacteroidales bacterium]